MVINQVLPIYYISPGWDNTIKVEKQNEAIRIQTLGEGTKDQVQS